MTPFLFFSHIILMVADDMACNPRNPRPGNLFINICTFVPGPHFNKVQTL